MKKQMKLGDTVIASDGPAGVVAKIIVDPEGREPDYIVVRRGRIRYRHIVVPVSQVIDVSEGKVLLSVSGAVLDEFPDYEVVERHGTYQRPLSVGTRYRPVGAYLPPSNAGYMVLHRRSVPPSSIAVEKGMVIRDATGQRVGRVAGLLLDSGSRSATHVLLQLPRPLAKTTAATSQPFMIPAALVAGVRDSEIHLAITRSQVFGLAIYVPAADQEGLATAVEEEGA
ncbi:MAG: hypothetical protein RRC07_15975 [Anaerolineae bacterium]|nr:hypothetical protein [Anaerolineae bacterium]